MFHFIKRLFGTQADRDIKQLTPYLKKINHHYRKLASLTHDALRAETQKLRNYLREAVQAIQSTIETLERQVAAAQDIKTQFALFAEIDSYKAKHNQKMEKALLAILPQAFALVKETARRFKENETLIVTATPTDHALAERYSHITIHNDQAHWSHTWQVAGNALTWDMVHYDVQLMGGVVLHQGKIAEMGTGEGKTLAATLPVFLNALSQKGVHVITVNDYLAKRDAEWMGPIFEFHGLSVACLEYTRIQSPERKKAYQADITYGTNSSFAFDFLYDNIAKTTDEQVQRDYFYAVVDEIDEALIDSARTPYIISGPRNTDHSKLYRTLKPRVKQLYQAQQKRVIDFLREAKQKIADGNQEEGGLSLFRAYRGLPTYTPLINFLSEKGIRKILATTENYFLAENSRHMPEADEPLFFTIDKKNDVVDVTEKGIAYFSQKEAQDSFFILPNIAVELDHIEKSDAPDDEKLAQKNKLIDAYSQKTARIHAVNQLLKAYTLFTRNVDYVVLDDQVKLVDQKTGRILKGRRLSDGLHESLEAKEDVRIARPSQTYATITPPNLFRRYHKVAGMTGTAMTEATEFLEIYHLEVVTIPPNKPVIRKDLPDRIYKTEREKLNAIAAMVREIQETSNRPILLITPSVHASEQIRKRLNIPANRILNAKNHHLEAHIIAQAGEPHALTVATQMAGRGTDIKVANEAEENGGLCVIITEKHETRRVVNQARGRAGRQGQAGSSVCFLSLEDPLIVHWQQGTLGRQVDRIWKKEGEVLIDTMISNLITGIQKDKEQSHFLARKRSLEYDNVMDKQRDVIYRRRNHALSLERLVFDTMYSMYHTLQAIVPEEITDNEEHTRLSLIEIGLTREAITRIMHSNQSRQKTVRMLYHLAREKQQAQETNIATLLYDKLHNVKEHTHALIPLTTGSTSLPITIPIAAIIQTQGQAATAAIQSAITLHTIDTLWTAHLEHMNELQETVRTASYENRDPLLVYKIEGVALFKKLLFNINKTITQQLLTCTLSEEHIALHHDGQLQALASQLQASKQDDLDDDSPPTPSPPVVEKPHTLMGRNQRVNVRYIDGTLKENVKYKTVAQDLSSGQCTLIDHP